MKIKLQKLRKLIRESISQDYKQKLWTMLWAGADDPANFVQAAELASQLGYKTFPGSSMTETEMSGQEIQDELYQRYFVSPDGWEEGLDAFKAIFNDLRSSIARGEDHEFEFNGNVVTMYIEFIIHEDGYDYDFGMGETSAVVPITLVNEIESEFQYQATQLIEASPWSESWIDIKCEVNQSQSELDEYQNGSAYLYITFK